jgi:hypothetical protein
MISSYVRWEDVRAGFVEQAGGEAAVEAGKQELLAEVLAYRLAEARPDGDGSVSESDAGLDRG